MAGKIIADTIQAAGDRITFNVGEVTVMTANSAGLTYIPTGNVSLNIANPSTITVGNLSVTTAVTTVLPVNAGIKFPATQVSSADANTLDDYEEGTFTPTIYGTSTAGTGTYNFQNGVYTKIGNMVYFACYINVTAHTGTGNMHMTGLPFTQKTVTNIVNPCASYNYGMSLSSGYYFQCYIGLNGSTNLYFEQVPTGGGTGAYVPIDTSFYIGLSGCYAAAA